MPFKRERYPDNWEQISKRIREERAGNKCEWCGVKNGATGARDKWDNWNSEYYINLMSTHEQIRRFGKKVKPIRIVLTVAHIDHDTTNNDDSNLAALCQRCHLRHDAKHHARNAAETRRNKRIEAGQLKFL